VELPPALAAHFASDSADAPYYVVWNGEGQVVQASRGMEGLEAPGGAFGPQFRMQGPEPPRTRERGGLREAWMNGPFGARVLVGQSVVAESGALRQLAFLLAATGAGVLVIGLAGGWLVSRRAVRPISTMSAVAGDISATQLSRRIDPEEVPSELQELAGVLNEMFSRLEAAFGQQIRFTADASHELRTPLAVIHTHTQLALSRERSAEEYKKALATSLRASTRMKGLVDSLLLLAGADAGRLSLEHERFDVKDVVEDCVMMVSTMAAERNITVATMLEPAEVVGDAARVGQVVTNLLTNAIRYNKEGGTVRVEVRGEKAEAVVRVEDTGVGIPEEHQAHVFERFYRVDAARSREAGGNGLGLAICKSIVEAHGGRIEVQSRVGVGTVLTVRLPREGVGA
jgi:heavy metal sensor kinase